MRPSRTIATINVLVVLLATACAVGVTEYAPPRDSLASSYEIMPIEFKSGLPLEGGTLEESVVDRLFLDSLQEDVLMIKRYPVLHFEVLGFTDNEECGGSDCEALAKRRAELVYQWLIQHGASRGSFEPPKGHGSDLAIGDNTTEAGRAQNRRVEVNIVPSSSPDF